MHRRSICRWGTKLLVVIIVIVIYFVTAVCSGPCTNGFYQSAACTPQMDRVCTGRKLTLIHCSCIVFHSIDDRAWISTLMFSHQSNYIILCEWKCNAHVKCIYYVPQSQHSRYRGADCIMWWSVSQELATNNCVCKCMYVRATVLSGVYYSSPSCQQGNYSLVNTA